MGWVGEKMQHLVLHTKHTIHLFLHWKINLKNNGIKKGAQIINGFSRPNNLCISSTKTLSVSSLYELKCSGFALHPTLRKSSVP